MEAVSQQLCGWCCCVWVPEPKEILHLNSSAGFLNLNGPQTETAPLEPTEIEDYHQYQKQSNYKIKGSNCRVKVNQLELSELLSEYPI